MGLLILLLEELLPASAENWGSERLAVSLLVRQTDRAFVQATVRRAEVSCFGDSWNFQLPSATERSIPYCYPPHFRVAPRPPHGDEVAAPFQNCGQF